MCSHKSLRKSEVNLVCIHDIPLNSISMKNLNLWNNFAHNSYKIQFAGCFHFEKDFRKLKTQKFVLKEIVFLFTCLVLKFHQVRFRIRERIHKVVLYNMKF